MQSKNIFKSNIIRIKEIDLGWDTNYLNLAFEAKINRLRHDFQTRSIT